MRRCYGRTKRESGLTANVAGRSWNSAEETIHMLRQGRVRLTITTDYLIYATFTLAQIHMAIHKTKHRFSQSSTFSHQLP